jgi:hypothetical protein
MLKVEKTRTTAGNEKNYDEFGDVKKVYNIRICMDPPKDKEKTITEYRTQKTHLVENGKEKAEGPEESEILICLGGDPNEKCDSELINMLEVLFAPKMDPSEKKRILEEEYDLPVTEEIEKELINIYNSTKDLEE